MTKSQTLSSSKQLSNEQSQLPTFMDHLNELKGRLFWVAIAFIISAGAAYPFFDQLIKIIVAPLDGQELYYTTPAGGLSLIIRICMYVGFIGMMPVFIYQLYKFVSPVMKKQSARSLVGYTSVSVLLSAVGIAFAYFVSLPASLYFLTNIEIGQVSSLLTLDAYLSFIAAYIIAGAFLFQLPLIMMLINTVSPLSVKQLMGYQRFLIVGAFIVAAIISPTPDAVNQTILAAPIVIMYQFGILIVWLRNRRASRLTKPVNARTALRPELRKMPIATGIQPAVKAPLIAVSTASIVPAKASEQRVASSSSRPKAVQPSPIRAPMIHKPVMHNTNVVITTTNITKPTMTAGTIQRGRTLDGFAAPPRYVPQINSSRVSQTLSRNITTAPRGPVLLDIRQPSVQ